MFGAGNKVESENCCANDACRKQIKDLADEIAAVTNEIKGEKEKYRRVLISNLQMDVNIDALEKQLKNERFSEFAQSLSDATIRILRSYTSSKTDDCKFVMSIIRDLYKENIDELQMITASGRSKNCDKKSISPEKADLINKIYYKRMQHAIEDGEVISKRQKCLNNLIKSAIETINSGQRKNIQQKPTNISNE